MCERLKIHMIDTHSVYRRSHRFRERENTYNVRKGSIGYSFSLATWSQDTFCGSTDRPIVDSDCKILSGKLKMYIP